MSHDDLGSGRIFQGIPGRVGIGITRRLLASRTRVFTVSASTLIDASRTGAPAKGASSPKIFGRGISPELPREGPLAKSKSTRRFRNLFGGSKIPRAPPPSLGSFEITPKPPAIAKVEPVTGETMSIHKSILKTIGGSIRSGIQGRVSGLINPQKILAGPAIAAAGRVLPGLGRAAAGLPGAAATGGFLLGSIFGGGGDGAACPSGYHPAKDGSGRCVRNRRMNFGNARAARRSVRRLKGARKLLKDIEKMMPTRSTRRRAPAGHTSHLHHSGGS